MGFAHPVEGARSRHLKSVSSKKEAQTNNRRRFTAVLHSDSFYIIDVAVCEVMMRRSYRFSGNKFTSFDVFKSFW